MGNRPATIEDVAALAGFSRQTVSRAINGNAAIRPETRDRIMAAVEELDYRPNLFARGLVTRQSQTVGLIVGDLTNPFFPDVAKGVLEEAESQGLVALVCNLGQGWDTLTPLNALALRGVDGYIVFPAAVDEEKIYEFADLNPPMVIVDAPFSHPAISNVRIDWQQGAVLAAEHLAEIGCRRPCVISSRTEHAADHRVVSFRERAAELGMPVRADAVAREDMTIDGGRQATAHLFGRDASYDSIFAFNDLVAIGAMEVLAERGIDVPRDVAVVGCDDIMLAAHVTPSLTSVSVNRYALGRTAMEQLHHRLQETHNGEAVFLDVSLTVRSSTKR